MTAFEKWVVQQGTKAAYINKKPLKETIAQLLFRECKFNQNPKAFEVLALTGDDHFTEATFENAADILIDKAT
jgi:hypothetical protein